LGAVGVPTAALDFGRAAQVGPRRSGRAGRAAQAGPITYLRFRSRVLASIRLALDALTTPKKVLVIAVCSRLLRTPAFRFN
jgi:hypothetical protein